MEQAPPEENEEPADSGTVEPTETFCRCGARVRWVVTAATGKRMMVDAKPEKRVILGTKTKKAHVVDTYMPHWATCPLADEFRKKGKGRNGNRTRQADGNS